MDNEIFIGGDEDSLRISRKCARIKGMSIKMVIIDYIRLKATEKGLFCDLYNFATTFII